MIRKLATGDRPLPQCTARAAIALLAAALLLAACAPRPSDARGTLIVLRHADRTWAALNDRGEARAEALRAALADLPIDAIYATPRGRNVATATPLARARGLAIHTLPARDAGEKIFAGNEGKTLVWVGNQENLGFLWAELHLPGKPPVQFGEVWVVTLPDGGGPATVERRHYGEDPAA